MQEATLTFHFCVSWEMANKVEITNNILKMLLCPPPNMGLPQLSGVDRSQPHNPFQSGTAKEIKSELDFKTGNGLMQMNQTRYLSVGGFYVRGMFHNC